MEKQMKTKIREEIKVRVEKIIEAKKAMKDKNVVQWGSGGSYYNCHLLRQRMRFFLLAYGYMRFRPYKSTERTVNNKEEDISYAVASQVFKLIHDRQYHPINDLEEHRLIQERIKTWIRQQ